MRLAHGSKFIQRFKRILCKGNRIKGNKQGKGFHEWPTMNAIQMNQKGYNYVAVSKTQHRSTEEVEKYERDDLNNCPSDSGFFFLLVFASFP